MLYQPLVGMVIVGVTVCGVVSLAAVPGHVAAWRIGAEGESATARALAPLVADGFIVLHDRLIPGSRANIDHIVIGPPGVAVVESKSYSGRLKVRGGEVFVGGRRMTSQTVEEAKREALAVTVALADELERRRLIVRPILCVHRADLPFFGASPQGVPIVSSRGLVKLLRKAPARLTREEVVELAGIANDRLRPAARPVPALEQRPLAVEATALAQSAPAPSHLLPITDAEDERFMPPVRRAHLQAAREAQARATNRRLYWTRKGLLQGQAPATIPTKSDRRTGK